MNRFELAGAVEAKDAEILHALEDQAALDEAFRERGQAAVELDDVLQVLVQDFSEHEDEIMRGIAAYEFSALTTYMRRAWEIAADRKEMEVRAIPV